MNILCKICYFVIGKCDCIGIFTVAIQSKSFKNLTIIEHGCNSKQIIQECDGNWTE